MSSSKKLRLLGAVSVFAVAAVMPLYAASQDFNDVAGVPFIKGTVLTCRASDFEKTVFEGNDNYSVCRLKTDSLKDQGKIVKENRNNNGVNRYAHLTSTQFLSAFL